ncbi:MAG: TlyA family rRNA (cytidine-2'-O)-methyltransferase [Phycisphaerae bacterium]|nr:TlyA family rRNA (cytidine-2'-O)-methyltransferase [Phycisphaerae bacterium]
MAGRNTGFVSRGGQKLNAAIEAFALDVTGTPCADFGCNVGGFTDCLLQRGAGKVYAVDTGYGELAWKLRKDPRVVVMERTNALYCGAAQRVGLVTIDLAWTPQRLSIPAAMRWLEPGGRIISLLKPHYELEKIRGRKPLSPLSEAQNNDVCLAVCRQLRDGGNTVRAVAKCPLTGKGGNREFFLLLRKEQ